MHKPAVVVPSNITLAEASRVIDEHKVGAAAVLDNGRLAGMVSERDLLRSVGHGIAPATTTVAEVMTRDPVSVLATDPVARALEIFRDRHFRHLPVLDAEGHVVGICSIRPLVRVAHIEEVRPPGPAPPGPAPPAREGRARPAPHARAGPG